MRRPSRSTAVVVAVIVVVAAAATAAGLFARMQEPGATATGTLVIVGQDFSGRGRGTERHQNPSGCYDLSGRGFPAFVRNETDTVMSLMDGRDCSGTVVGVVRPGESRSAEAALAVRVG